MKNYSKIYVNIISFILIVLFLYTGINKALGLDGFRLSVNKSNLLRPIYYPVIILIPPIELFLAVGLMYTKTQKASLLLSSILLMLFTLYVGYMLLYEPHLPCSCGGIISLLSWKNHLALNLLLTILSFIAYFLNKRNHNRYQFANSL